MRKLTFVAGLLFLSHAGFAQEINALAAANNEALAKVSIFGRCVGSVNQLTVDWDGTADSFAIYYNGRIIGQRSVPGTLTFQPGTRVSKITVKGCKNSVCDSDSQTWNGQDCGRPGSSVDPL